MCKCVFHQSRLVAFPYLCIVLEEDVITAPNDQSATEYCKGTFGNQADKYGNNGVWYEGVLGFYFKNQNDAVQFMLSRS